MSMSLPVDITCFMLHYFSCLHFFLSRVRNNELHSNLSLDITCIDSIQNALPDPAKPQKKEHQTIIPNRQYRGHRLPSTRRWPQRRICDVIDHGICYRYLSIMLARALPIDPGKDHRLRPAPSGRALPTRKVWRVWGISCERWIRVQFETCGINMESIGNHP